jgi:hypothetical protein
VLNPTIVPESDGPTFSYADIVDMIKNNKPIPGIKDIPDTVLEGQGTQSKKSTRRKPWEKDDEATEEPVTKGAEQVSA